MNTTQHTATQLPPASRRLPLFGNLLSFRRDQLGYLQQLQQTYGNMATIYVGKAPIVLLFRPEHVRYILTENPRNFTSREVAKNLGQLLGDGLLTIDGETHRLQRRMVQPAFHKKRVEGYADIMVKHTLDMLKNWHEGETIDITRAMQELTLRIVGKCLFNVDLSDGFGDLGSSFNAMISNPVSLLEGFFGLQIDKPFTSYGRRMAAKRTLDTFIYQLIEQRRADKQDAGDVLSMLLMTHEGEDTLTDTQIRDHTMTFVAAGHETTSLALTWTFYLLSKYPASYEKLLNELQSVLGSDTPTIDNIGKLPYLEWVLNESMRLYPPAWTQGRRATEAFDLDGYHFPAGTVLLFSQWVVHRLPDIWEAPTEFRPERWDPVSGQKIPQWAYFPFGGGPRMCIGMPFAQLEAKLLLATILQQYRLQLVPDYRLQLVPLITLRPKHAVPMTIKAASSNAEKENAIEARV
ncbi:MAG: cytochrome P450 [Ktedonobacteraceae bacterium]|nr:cytochrome P450 [Ktedonobacteraceae bacterium]